MKKYFFTPRVGKDYEKGFHGIKTLILGSHFYCPYTDCSHLKEGCASSNTIWSMDAACPCYVGKEDQNYYKLSNSDTIEVDSYLEGFPYPSFDAFTYLMLNKRDYLSEDEKLLFWDQIAFTNYIQHYWPNGYTPPYEDNESLFDADYEAFKEVLTELRPQIVIVWNKAIKDCLLSNGDLQFVGMINIPIISTYMFIYEGAEPELSPKQLEKLKKEYNIISEKIETKWLRELLIESFNDPHAVEAFRQKIEYVKCIQGGRSDSNIDNIVTLLKRCATQKLIIRMGNKLNFGPGLSRVHKEIFLKLIKESFDAPLKGLLAHFTQIYHLYNLLIYNILRRNLQLFITEFCIFSPCIIFISNKNSDKSIEILHISPKYITSVDNLMIHIFSSTFNFLYSFTPSDRLESKS